MGARWHLCGYVNRFLRAVLGVSLRLRELEQHGAWPDVVLPDEDLAVLEAAYVSESQDDAVNCLVEWAPRPASRRH